jgi:hypothetical protein
MRKTCVQAVGVPRISMRSSLRLSTHLVAANSAEWKNQAFYPPSMHNFCIQLCTPKMAEITGATGHSSPLSTVPTTNTSDKTKEIFLVVSGG